MSRFPPVRRLPGLTPWSAPQTLEAIPEIRRMAPAIASGAVVQARDAAPVREAHRYAQINGSVVFPVSVTSRLVLPAPQNFRNLLIVRNSTALGGQTVYLEFGREANGDSAIELTPGGTILFDTVVPQDDIYAIAPGGPTSITVSFSNINFLESAG
jgi:hypothetical protein